MANISCIPLFSVVERVVSDDRWSWKTFCLQKEETVIQPVNSRDVMPKNVPGMGRVGVRWVMKSVMVGWDGHGGVGWVMEVETLRKGGGSLSIDMRLYGC